ncbi:hypothetical protein ACWZHB_33595 [Nocardia sp. FBN12]|uniref:hypothetical protein n=1 Tax=Nocardia sp. FBN12 TaxID=3419766 RepID=UPI003CFDF616
MSDSRIPVFSADDQRSGARGAMLGGAIATIAGLWLPLFTLTAGARPTAPSRSMWDLHQSGTPGFPLFVLGAVLLIMGSFIPAHLEALGVRGWLAGVAVAVGIGILLAISIGYSTALTNYSAMSSSSVSHATFHYGLLVLVAGPAAAVVGSWQLWVADARSSG